GGGAAPRPDRPRRPGGARRGRVVDQQEGGRPRPAGRDRPRPGRAPVPGRGPAEGRDPGRRTGRGPRRRRTRTGNPVTSGPPRSVTAVKEAIDMTRIAGAGATGRVGRHVVG